MLDRVVNSYGVTKQEYGFKKHPTKDEWTSQPTFEGWLGTPKFIEDGNEAEKFFKRTKNNDWKKLNKRSRLNLLYITAARYLLVTKILYEQYLKEGNKNSKVVRGMKLTPCVETVYGGGLHEIPDSGVCFLPPYGSATCTSDYDVGLVGKNAGILTRAFNDYFQQNFLKPSEVAFDTNVYAFTLEFALPSIFVKLPQAFVLDLKVKEAMMKYQMQELASAYYKVFKYNRGFFTILVETATKAMGALSKRGKMLKTWLDTFKALPVKLTVQDFNNEPETLRTMHNAKYQELVENISNMGGYKAELLGIHIYKVFIYKKCICQGILTGMGEGGKGGG